MPFTIVVGLHELFTSLTTVRLPVGWTTAQLTLTSGIFMSIEVTDSVTKHSLSYALVRRTGNITSEFAGTKTDFTVLAKLDFTACFCSLHVNFPASVIVLVWKSINACWSVNKSFPRITEWWPSKTWKSCWNAWLPKLTVRITLAVTEWAIPPTPMTAEHFSFTCFTLFFGILNMLTEETGAPHYQPGLGNFDSLCVSVTCFPNINFVNVIRQIQSCFMYWYTRLTSY